MKQNKEYSDGNRISVKFKGFGFEDLEFEVVSWTMWSLEGRASLETPS
jgi:hypothetical protein